MKPTALTMTLPLAASHAAFADLPRPTFYCTFDRRSDAGFGVGDASSATMAPDAILVAEADRLRKGGVDRLVVKGKVSKARRFDAGALFPVEGNFSPLRGTVIRRQNHRPAETAAPKTFVQIAIAHQDKRGHNCGHVSTTDLFHWRHHPTRLVSGMFSGNCFINKDGRPARVQTLQGWEMMPSNPY